ncbi:serine protease [Patescibacteria group bacterium]|nr:serine protease [Patescibacteria group bacterium]
MTKNILKIIIIFVVGLCGGLFGSQIVWPSYQSASLPTSIIESKEIIIQENTALQNSVEKIEKAIVGVKTKTKGGEIVSGSGLVVTSDGLIITLSELVPLKGDFTFFIDGKTPNWQILKRDTENNLVLIKLDLNDLTTVSFSNIDEIKLGERVFLGGTIFNGTKPLVVVNEGIVKFFTEEYIRTNIIEKKTLSGSALFNIKGELLGLNTIDDEERVTAIPINKIKSFLGY